MKATRILSRWSPRAARLPESRVRELADGRIYSGSQGPFAGFWWIDLAGLDETIQRLMTDYQLEERCQVVYHAPPQPTFWEQVSALLPEFSHRQRRNPVPRRAGPARPGAHLGSGAGGSVMTLLNRPALKQAARGGHPQPMPRPSSPSQPLCCSGCCCSGCCGTLSAWSRWPRAAERLELPFFLPQLHPAAGAGCCSAWRRW